MKKALIKMLVIIMAVCSTGCDNSVNKSINGADSVKNNYTSSTTLDESKVEPDYRDIVLNTESTDLEDISKKIFDIYLSKFRQKNADNHVKLDEYRIQDVKIQKGGIDNFQFLVGFEIKPSSDVYILAGNGEKQPDGWVAGKTYFVTVTKEEEGFKISDIGTSP